MYGDSCYGEVPYGAFASVVLFVAACVNVNQEMLFYTNVKIAPLFNVNVTQDKC